jgi:hypothetical protein
LLLRLVKALRRVGVRRNGGEVIVGVSFVREILLLHVAVEHEFADGRGIEDVAKAARGERRRIVDPSSLLLTALIALRRKRRLLVEEEAEDASALAAERLRRGKEASVTITMGGRRERTEKGACDSICL